jgi:hypothetical protein
MLNGLALRNGFEAAPKVRKNRFKYSATSDLMRSLLAILFVPAFVAEASYAHDVILSNLSRTGHGVR